MKKLLLSSFAALAFAGSSAFAADLRMPVKAPMAPPPVVTSWTGCYIDGGVGYGVGNEDVSTTGTVPVLGTLTSSTATNGVRGWLGRVGGGCDYQVGGSWVIGAFADYDFMNETGSLTPTGEIVTLGGLTQGVTANLKESSAVYAGGRIGYLVTPSVLTFVSGGWTTTHFTQTAEFATVVGGATGFTYPGSFNADGWFIGGGTETALADFLPGLPHGLFLKTEYRFAQYDSRTLAETSVATGAATGFSERVKPYNQTVTTSLVWRFNFGR